MISSIQLPVQKFPVVLRPRTEIEEFVWELAKMGREKCGVGINLQYVEDKVRKIETKMDQSQCASFNQIQSRQHDRENPSV